VPNVATTDTNVPGQVAAAQLRTVIGSRSMNEFQFHFSGNKIGTINPRAPTTSAARSG
jgi:hypothetical protein